MPLFKKRHCSATLMASTISSSTSLNHTPTMKPHVASPMPIKGRVVAIIARAIVGNSRLLPVHSRFLPVKFPPIDQIWQVLSNLDFSLYLKSARTHKKYTHLVKYFHAYLVFIVWRVYLPEVKAIFWGTLLP